MGQFWGKNQKLHEQVGNSRYTSRDQVLSGLYQYALWERRSLAIIQKIIEDLGHVITLLKIRGEKNVENNDQ